MTPAHCGCRLVSTRWPEVTTPETVAGSSAPVDKAIDADTMSKMMSEVMDGINAMVAN